MTPALTCSYIHCATGQELTDLNYKGIMTSSLPRMMQQAQIPKNLQTWTTKGLWHTSLVPPVSVTLTLELTDLNYKGIMTELIVFMIFSYYALELTDLNYKGIMTGRYLSDVRHIAAPPELTDLNYKGIMTIGLSWPIPAPWPRTYRPELQRDYDRYPIPWRCLDALWRTYRPELQRDYDLFDAKRDCIFGDFNELTDLNYKGIMTQSKSTSESFISHSAELTDLNYKGIMTPSSRTFAP